MEKDPVIDRVRKVRHEISERLRHDPKALTQYYIERQERHADRLIRCNRPAETPKARDSD